LRLLIDTHVAIWAIGEPERLSDAVADLIVDRSNEIFVSIVALWEIAIKRSTGSRRKEPLLLPVGMAQDEFALAGFSMLRIDLKHLLAVETLPFHHRDPFDRLMVAQAEVEGMQFLTSDRQLGTYGQHVRVM
jgi:PIN domain nuclease of toxin-antitoxin system